ncbi:unnamed protein product [Cuscuta campestris]|uniref:Uncharacterized protein n=1 Tax=Cuscuta campestris TaxID=132261 RepID=A0A484MKV6_9ASTE|nr:unnamed protein product [Cuscuta campestris]
MRLLSISRDLAQWLIEVLSRPVYSKENWEITKFNGDSTLKVCWDSNCSGQYARLSTDKVNSPIFIPAGYSLDGLKLFCKSLSEILRISEQRLSEGNQMLLRHGEKEGSRFIQANMDEGWRCFHSELGSGGQDEEQKGYGNSYYVDSTHEKEMESMRRHTPDVEPPIDQDCLKQFDQVIRDNINIFRKSIANKKFLHALKNGQVLSFSGEVIRVTREAMKSFEFIDAAKIEGAKYPVFLAYANEDMNVVLNHLCAVQE